VANNGLGTRLSIAQQGAMPDTCRQSEAGETSETSELRGYFSEPH